MKKFLLSMIAAFAVIGATVAPAVADAPRCQYFTQMRGGRIVQCTQCCSYDPYSGQQTCQVQCSG